jgi:hypothetical protein
MFEHFRAFFSNKHNVSKAFAIIGVLIFVIVLNQLGLYEGYATKRVASAPLQ